MASPAMRIAILAACADTFYVLIDGLHFEPRCVDEFSKRSATLALHQPAMIPPWEKLKMLEPIECTRKAWRERLAELPPQVVATARVVCRGPLGVGVGDVRMMACRASFACAGRIVSSLLRSISGGEEPTAHNPCRGYRLSKKSLQSDSIQETSRVDHLW
jgi:hypothetical protein